MSQLNLIDTLSSYVIRIHFNIVACRPVARQRPFTGPLLSNACSFRGRYLARPKRNNDYSYKKVITHLKDWKSRNPNISITKLESNNKLNDCFRVVQEMFTQWSVTYGHPCSIRKFCIGCVCDEGGVKPHLIWRLLIWYVELRIFSTHT
jgi:hypothetical protein